MNAGCTYIDDLASRVEIPENGILSRTLYEDDQMKIMIFGFDKGQELSQHTASLPAVLHIIRGQAKMTLAGDSVEAQAGAWVHMSPHLSHSIYARTPLVMLLQLVKRGKETGAT